MKTTRHLRPPFSYRVLVFVSALFIFIAGEIVLPSASGVAFAQTVHRVRQGETLSGIAVRYGVTVGQIQRANRLPNVNQIYVGQPLVIPTAPSAPSAPAVKPAPSRPVVKPPAAKPAPSAPKPHCPYSYIVQRGDTLSGLAARTSSSTVQVRQCNGLAGDTIYVGQTLRLLAPVADRSTPGSRIVPTDRDASSARATPTPAPGKDTQIEVAAVVTSTAGHP